MITRRRDGGPYGPLFLDHLENDLRKLSVDFEKSGGTTAGAEKLLRAADVIKRIRIENAAEISKLIASEL